MGHSTKYEGILRFKHDITVIELTHLQGILGEDIRDHPEWEIPSDSNFVFVDLRLTKDFSGLEWSGAEKTRDMENQIRFVVKECLKISPWFILEGVLHAEGESTDDRYDILVKSNAVSREVYQSSQIEEGSKDAMGDLDDHFQEIITKWLWENQGEDYLSVVNDLSEKLLWVVAQYLEKG